MVRQYFKWSDLIYKYSFSVAPLVLTIPNFLAISVKGNTTIINSTANQTLHSLTVYRSNCSPPSSKYILTLQWSPLAESHNRLLYKLNVWFYSFFLKLVPCTLLSIITCLLIRALVQVKYYHDKEYTELNESMIFSSLEEA